MGVFDVDRDGKLDIVTDEYWYAGPNFTPHEIRTPQTYDPANAFSDCFAIYPQDIDGDGWADIIVAPHVGDAMYWYENPKAADMHWPRHLLSPQGAPGLETPIVADLFGDGRQLVVMTDTLQGVLGWFTAPADPTQPWDLHPISGPGYVGSADATHGIGVGDVDGDGRTDVMTSYGWFRQTSDPNTWAFHSTPFGSSPPGACSRMFARDLDGDGLGDILCSRPHDYGLHWFSQVKGAMGSSFVDHVIDSSISQMHALRLDDLDGDGVPEIISGKRFWAHGSATDPGVNDPAVLVYYSIIEGPGGVSFERHDIDADSGIGDQFAIADLDGDGKSDIVTSNKKGLAVFRQR
ncbi:MAG: FG-GAP repeat domain-containing protein [Polyangiaceae bacterium]